MRQYTRMLQSAIGLFLVMSCISRASLADDVPLPLRDFLQHPELFGYSLITIFATNFCATVAIEYLVICLFLDWPTKAMGKLFSWVLLLNAITNPAAQAAALLFGKAMGSEPIAWGMIGMVELVATAVEFVLLRQVLGNMYRQGTLKEAVTARRTVLMVAVANAASFAFGFVGPIFLLMEAGY